MPSDHLHKRLDRTESHDALLLMEGGRRLGEKRHEDEASVWTDACGPLLAPLHGESKAAFFARLGGRLRRGIFSVAHTFDRDGLYLYKRPVRSGAGTDKGALLAAAGSVFHHTVVYVKSGDELTALEFGPANKMDITENLMEETPAGPVVLRPAPRPDPTCLPMLHLGGAAHHPLDAPHVQQALAWAQCQSYHALRQNCIAFADFAVRVLTGGAVRGAPLIFDRVVGTVPETDSPLVPLLALMGLRWHDVCDGSRLLLACLQHQPEVLQPVEGACTHVLHEPAEGEAEAAVPPAAPAGLAANPLAALLTGLLPPQPAAPRLQPEDSGSSEDTCGGVVEANTLAAGTSAAASVSGVSSFASTSDSHARRGAPPKGLGVPACAAHAATH